jgi:hypothetical protein
VRPFETLAEEAMGKTMTSGAFNRKIIKKVRRPTGPRNRGAGRCTSAAQVGDAPRYTRSILYIYLICT